jgi:hypothetical protein
MKNLEIMTGQFAAAARSSGSTLRPGMARMMPPTTARSSLCRPAFDHAQIADELPDVDAALLHHIVGVDDKHIAAGLVGPERGIGHQQSRLRFVGNAHVHEIAGQQAAIGVGQAGARCERAGPSDL